MAFTDRSDLFAAVHENGVNATISQLMLQRPSMFNYATILFTQALSSQLCVPINPRPGAGRCSPSSRRCRFSARRGRSPSGP
jgi:hypothetical protein